MPTDVAFVMKRKAEAERRIKRDAFADFLVNCVWAMVGFFFALLILKEGIDPETVVFLTGSG